MNWNEKMQIPESILKKKSNSENEIFCKKNFTDGFYRESTDDSPARLDNEDFSVLDYTFTKKEVFLMAKFLRQNEEKLPEGLESFHHIIEDSIYNTLSLDEVKRFFNEK